MCLFLCDVDICESEEEEAEIETTKLGVKDGLASLLKLKSFFRRIDKDYNENMMESYEKLRSCMESILNKRKCNLFKQSTLADFLESI